MSKLAEGSTIKLVGYGEREGETLDVTFVGIKGDLIICETMQNGKKAQGKYQKATGMSINGTKEKGLKIPDETLKAILGSNGKTSTTKRTPKSKNESGICYCGCGGKATSKFIQGHDAKAHSYVKKFLRGQLPQEDLAKASAYVQEKVKEEGGYNTQQAPKGGKKGTGDGFTYTRQDGKVLYGAAAKAAAANAEKEQAAVAANGGAPN